MAHEMYTQNELLRKSCFRMTEFTFLTNAISFRNIKLQKTCYPTTLLISLYLHTPFAHLICSTLLHSASNSAGEATMMQIHFARLVATFNRFGLNRKFNPRGASWTVEAARE